MFYVWCFRPFLERALPEPMLCLDGIVRVYKDKMASIPKVNVIIAY